VGRAALPQPAESAAAAAIAQCLIWVEALGLRVYDLVFWPKASMCGSWATWCVVGQHCIGSWSPVAALGPVFLGQVCRAVCMHGRHHSLAVAHRQCTTGLHRWLLIQRLHWSWGNWCLLIARCLAALSRCLEHDLRCTPKCLDRGFVLLILI
jgi:hypothetical protein